MIVDVSIYVFIGLVGLAVGSFLNVVIYRVPIGLNLSVPASHCPNCQNKIKWYDNIPVLSYLILGGKCRNCKTKISIRYTIVEILNCVLWLFCWYNFSSLSVMYAIIALLATSVFISVFFIDLEHKIIPDRFHIILLILGIVACFSGDGILWYERLIGMGAGLAIFSAFYFGSIWILKKEGLGFGDVKLVTAVGLLLGWKNILLSIFISSILACVILLTISLVKKKDREYEFPFAPFLIVGMFIAMCFGSPIINWYLTLIIGG